jgi:5'-deoxynucleotidase YfbR-like HD superfamily hydrolase
MRRGLGGPLSAVYDGRGLILVAGIPTGCREPDGRARGYRRTRHRATAPLRLARQIAFLIEIDQLKSVLRRSSLANLSRRENDAEHSWHLAMFAVLLVEYAASAVDERRVLRMLLIHDLVEVYGGDTFIYDAAATAGQEERERLAADRLFPQLPDDQAAALRALWDEFEQRRTPDAKFARALDRVQPLAPVWRDARGRPASPGGHRGRLAAAVGVHPRDARRGRPSRIPERLNGDSGVETLTPPGRRRRTPRLDRRLCPRWSRGPLEGALRWQPGRGTNGDHRGAVTAAMAPSSRLPPLPSPVAAVAVAA